MITITIQTDTAEQARTEMGKLLELPTFAFKAEATNTAPAPKKIAVKVAEDGTAVESPASAVFAAAVEATAETPVVEEKKERKPRKAKEVAPTEAPPPVAANLPASEDPTLDNARLWIKAVVANDGANGDKGGLESAQKILTGLGVGKVSEIPESKYNLLIADCKKILTAAAPKEDIF